MQFKVGDLVTLKSGSVPMTVIGIDATGFMVTWYHGDYNAFSTAKFPGEALEASKS